MGADHSVMQMCNASCQDLYEQTQEFVLNAEASIKGVKVCERKRGYESADRKNQAAKDMEQERLREERERLAYAEKIKLSQVNREREKVIIFEIF